MQRVLHGIPSEDIEFKNICLTNALLEMNSGFLLRAGRPLFLLSIHINVTGYREKISPELLKPLQNSSYFEKKIVLVLKIFFP